MLTTIFAVFVIVVLILHNITSGRLQNIVLLLASYIAYAYWDVRFLALLLLSTAIIFLISRRLGTNRRRLLFILGLVWVIGSLVFFKKLDFFVPATAALFAKLGWQFDPTALQLVLPVGISFYSFRLLAWLFDSYNRRIDVANASWINFALYVAFFPQIVSGPIERPANFLTKMKDTRRLDSETFFIGLTYIFVGLYYKIAIADPLVARIDAAFASPATQSGQDALAAIILFSIQIYADFAGYSAIAIGISRWFGLPAMENFRQPYLSQSVIEFWTRWHISLSSWFRDYFFYPLSRYLLKRWGSRRTSLVQTTSYLSTMILTGLWHGISFPFFVWGFLHGTYMSIEAYIARRRGPYSADSVWHKRLNVVVNVLITQAILGIAWVFFRANTLQDGFALLRQLQHFTAFPTPDWWVAVLVPLLMVCVIDFAQAWTKDNTVLWQVNLGWRVALCSFMILALFIFGAKVSAPFVYFRF